MENVQMEIVEKEMEIKEIGVDKISVRLVGKTEMQDFSEEEEEEFVSEEEEEMSETENSELRNEYVVSSRDEMIQKLESFKDDTLVTMEIIKTANIRYTEDQRNIIEKIEKEYEEWCSPTRMVNYFDKFVAELRDTFYYQKAEEEDFYQDQVRCYYDIYRTLTRYPFPYSDRQINLLESYKSQISWTTGDPTLMTDIELLEDLQGLMSLMVEGDHIHCSTFYVECTVNFYVQQMINDLYYPVEGERRRKVPDCISEGALVNVASYVTRELKSMFNGIQLYSQVNLFHLGLSQIYIRMINIFRFSGLLFGEHKGKLMQLLLKEIEEVVKNPTNENYDGLFLGFYGFMDALRRDHQECEYRIENGVKIVDEEGMVAKAIKKIMREFYELQIAAEEHHKHFEDYTIRIPDITSVMFKYVLRIFPPNHRVAIRFMLPNGYYVSSVAREWVHDA